MVAFIVISRYASPALSTKHRVYSLFHLYLVIIIIIIIIITKREREREREREKRKEERTSNYKLKVP